MKVANNVEEPVSRVSGGLQRHRRLQSEQKAIGEQWNHFGADEMGNYRGRLCRVSWKHCFSGILVNAVTFALPFFTWTQWNSVVS